MCQNYAVVGINNLRIQKGGALVLRLTIIFVPSLSNKSSALDASLMPYKWTELSKTINVQNRDCELNRLKKFLGNTH